MARLSLVSLAALFWVVGAIPAQQYIVPEADAATALHVTAKQAFDAGDFLKAEATEREAIAACLKWLDKNRGDVAQRIVWAQCHNELAHAQSHLDKFADAKATLNAVRGVLEKSIEFYPKERGFRFELARTLRVESVVYHMAMLPTESADHLEKSLAVLRKLADEDPGQGSYRKELADGLLHFAFELRELGRIGDSEKTYQESIRVMQKLTADFPSTPEHVERLAVAYNAYALLVRESGRRTQAIELIRQAIALLKNLESAYPERPQLWYQLPTFYRNLAQPLGTLHRYAEAKAAQRNASRMESKLVRIPNPEKKGVSDADKIVASIQNLDMTRLVSHGGEIDAIRQRMVKKVQDHPEIPAFRMQLAAALSIDGIRIVGDQKQVVGDAQLPVGTAVALMTKLVTDFPDIPKYRYALGETYGRQAIACLADGQDREADKNHQETIAILDKLARDYPKVPKFRFAVSDWMFRACLAYKGIGDVERERKYFGMALKELRLLAEAHPGVSEYWRHLADSHLTYGLIQEPSEATAAEAHLREGIGLWEQTVRRFPEMHSLRMHWGVAQRNLAQFLTKSKREKEAEEAFRMQIQILDQLAKDTPREAEHQVLASIAHSYLAEHLEAHNRWAESLEARRRALTLLEAALALAPRQPDWLNYYRISHRQRAFTHYKLGNFAENQRDEARAKELDEKVDAPLTRLLRIDQRLREDRLDLALAEAEELIEHGDLSGQEWFQLAESFVQAGEKAKQQATRDQCHGRAVLALNKALDDGYRGIAPIDQNPRLSPLFARADFKRLAANDK